MMRPESIENILVTLHAGPWFGFDNKEHLYENLVVYNGYDKPTKSWLETELADQQVAWDAAVADEAANKASAKSKLAALGLSEDEISAAFGI
jgi:hypothetical protein